MGTATATTSNRWLAGLRAYLQRRMLAMVSLGFASGLPYMLIYSELAYWMKQEGVDLSVIGFFAWIGMAYTFKFIWAPVVDGLRVPVLGSWLGHRRAWMLVAMIGVLAGALTIASANPGESVLQLAVGAVILATSGATLDISIDAWRIESAPADEQAGMAAAYVLGYRLAIIGAGVSYIIAGATDWNVAYASMAAIMAVNGLVIFLIREPARPERPVSRNMADAVGEYVVRPFTSFTSRLGPWTPVVFALVATYLISDKTMGPMAKPMYEEVGYSATQIGIVSSFFGPWPVILGGLVSGVMAVRFGLLRCMLIGSVLMVITNAAFAWLSTVTDPKTAYLFVTVGADNLAQGYAATVFIAYLSSLCEVQFAATQYAFLSAMFNFVGKGLSGFTGQMAERMGFESFFIFSASLGIPAILLTLFIMRYGSPLARGEAEKSPTEEVAA